VTAFQVWVKWVNAHGGINGHQVIAYIDNDNGDSATHLADVKDLVENKHVIAFVDQFSSAHDASMGYINQQRIPVVGGESGGTIWYTNPMMFPQSDQGLGSIFADFGRISTSKKVAVFACVESANCTAAANGIARRGSAYGYQVVYNSNGSLAQPDFTANCLQMQSSGAGIVAAIFDWASVMRIEQSCSQQGYHPKYFTTYGTEAPAETSLAGFAGSGGANPVFAYTLDNTAPTQAFHAAFAEFAPGVTPDEGTAVGWAGAQMFEAAAQGVTDSPTTAEILKGLWSMKGFTTGGLTQPRTFSPSALPVRTDCSWFMLISGGQWTTPDGDAPRCNRFDGFT
jgi:branched-chain amino acid transport system substrate-binding protein